MTTFKTIFLLILFIKILSSSQILLEKQENSGKYLRFHQKINGLNEIIHLIETSKEDLLSNNELKALVNELKSIIDLMQMKIYRNKDEKEGKALKNKEKHGKRHEKHGKKGKKKRIISLLKEILLKTEENLNIQEKIHEFLFKFNKKRS